MTTIGSGAWRNKKATLNRELNWVSSAENSELGRGGKGGIIGLSWRKEAIIEAHPFSAGKVGV
jgi:hypothetical protein